MPSVRAPHVDHLPTHRTARDTDDVGVVWLRRTGFWATLPAGVRVECPSPALPAPAGSLTVDTRGRGRR